MSAWWDDLPDGSVIRDGGGDLFERWGGKWHSVTSEREYPDSITDGATVIHVPVTDTEPPVGSVVACGREVWMRVGGRAGQPSWAQLAGGSGHLNMGAHTWGRLHPNVTRILRWGE